jgi:agmatine deiminase
MPSPVEYEGNRLPASYANFYIANGVVLVPTYQCPNDQRALATLQELFPARQIVGIPCIDLVWGLGAIHCVTQQQPALV